MGSQQRARKETATAAFPMNRSIIGARFFSFAWADGALTTCRRHSMSPVRALRAATIPLSVPT